MREILSLLSGRGVKHVAEYGFWDKIISVISNPDEAG